MNKHIELVEKWLADPSSVSKEELKANNNAANTAFAAAFAADRSANAVLYNADIASFAAAYGVNADSAEEWVAKYHKSVKEQGQ